MFIVSEYKELSRASLLRATKPLLFETKIFGSKDSGRDKTAIRQDKQVGNFKLRSVVIFRKQTAWDFQSFLL